jgi:hypothetical protein
MNLISLEFLPLFSFSIGIDILNAATLKELESFLVPETMPAEEEEEPVESFVANVLLDSPQRGNAVKLEQKIMKQRCF